MKIVMLIILIVLIIFTALSFIPETEDAKNLKTTVNLKSVNGNEQFYEKIGATKKEEKLIINNKEEEKLIINNKEEEKNNEPKTIILPENNIEFEIVKWNLIGQQNNVLIIDLKIKNGFQNNIKELKKTIKCKILNESNEILNEINTEVNINIKEKSEIILKDINMGFVDIDTKNINCSILDYIEKERIDTSIKPLKELSKNKNTQQTQQGGFIFSNGETNKEEDDFSLPELN